MKYQTLPLRSRLPPNLTFHVYISSPYLLIYTSISLNGAVTPVKSFLVVFFFLTYSFPPLFITYCLYLFTGLFITFSQIHDFHPDKHEMFRIEMASRGLLNEGSNGICRMVVEE